MLLRRLLAGASAATVSRIGVTLVGCAVIDVAGVYLFLVVVEFRFKGPGLPENLTAQRVSEERFNVGRVGRDHEVQQISRGRVVGDEVRGGIADAEIKDLYASGAFPGGHFTGALSHLVSVVGAGHQDADRPVEHLVRTIQHQILVMRGQYCGRDLIAAAKY
jgi:hypothetical protein